MTVKEARTAKLSLEYYLPNSYQRIIKEVYIDPKHEENIKLWLEEEFGEIAEYLNEKKIKFEDREIEPPVVKPIGE